MTAGSLATGSRRSRARARLLGIEARLAAREFEATSRRKTLMMMTGSKLVALAITTAITVLSTVSSAMMR